MSDEIINKVALSALVELDLQDFYPKEEIVLFDLRPHLFMEQILKEKDFRTALQNTDWSIYRDKIVAVTCSVDAIIPVWAYMLVATHLQPFAANLIMGDKNDALQQTMLQRIGTLDIGPFAGKRVVVKGCGELPVAESAYMEITKRLLPVTKSIMYGEPCSTVPIYKSK
jgi:hypothetical protein